MDRTKALEWWKKLDLNSQRDLAFEFFPHMPFIAVDKSSSMINRIADSLQQRLSAIKMDNKVVTCALDRGTCTHQFGIGYLTGCRDTNECKHKLTTVV